MKKKFLFLIIFLLIIILSYLGYKTYNLYYYNYNDIISKNDFNSLKDKYSLKETLTINTTPLKDEEYLTIKNIKIKNNFKYFNELDDLNDITGYTKRYSNPGKKAAFMLTFIDNNYNIDFIDYFQKDAIFFGNSNAPIRNTTTKDRIKYLKKNNISTDIELFKHISKMKYPKSNIFTSVKEIKSTYSFLTVLTILPQYDSISIINGDFTGYLYKINNSTEIKITKNNKKYSLSFIGNDYFTEDKIKETLNTLIIED